MKMRKVLTTSCWAALIGWNVIVVSVTIVSEPYIELRRERFRIESASDDTSTQTANLNADDVHVFIRSDDLAFVPLPLIGFVNLAMIAGLLILVTWEKQTAANG